jgi:hypothetical protein
MPQASRHVKRKPIAVRLSASILAAATLAGVAVAFVFLSGGPVPAKLTSQVKPVTTVTAAADVPVVAYQADAAVRQVSIRAGAVTRHKHHHARRGQHIQSAPAPAAAPASAQPAATPVAVRGGQDAASSPLGVCIRDVEEGGSYAWGPGNGGGAYQFLLATWEKYGGAASEYGVAGPAYQNQVFDNAIAAGGAANWTAYDGC